MWDFDVIIVGAGPGGSNAATVALRSGLKVAQIEAARFPRVKPCAGGLTIKAVRALQADVVPPRSSFSALEFNVWGRRRNRFCHGSTVLHTVCRPQFDNDLVHRNLSQPNFTFLDDHRVAAIEYDGCFKVCTSRGVLRGAQLIGADGAYSLVNRTFGIASPRATATALEINVEEGETRQAVPCLDYGAIPFGYGWVFPKANHVSVGLYTLAPRSKHIRDALRSYARSKELIVDSRGRLEAFRLPVGGYIARVPPCPVYIVGDAGGFADGLTGEGIYYALESGRLAGETAVDVAAGNANHRAYYRRLWPTVLCDTTATFFAARAFYRNVECGFRILESPLVWRPLIHGAATGATFAASILKCALLLQQSLKHHATREQRTWNADASVASDCAIGCALSGSA